MIKKCNFQQQIFEAYKLIYRDDREQNAELVIKYNDTRTSLEIYLRSKSQEIELEKCKVSILNELSEKHSFLSYDFIDAIFVPFSIIKQYSKWNRHVQL